MDNKVIILIFGLSFIVGCFTQFLPVVDSCIQCSSFTNITCATNPDSHQRLPCSGASEGCYTRIHDGFTIRGCRSELDEGVIANCQNDRCTLCGGTPNEPVFGCNNQIFPEHRQQCHQCTGPINGTCGAIPQDIASVCELFDVNDRCYVQRTSDTVTRGCISSRGTNCENPDRCHICEISGCNNVNWDQVPESGSAIRNKISIVMLSTAFIFALAKFI